MKFDNMLSEMYGSLLEQGEGGVDPAAGGVPGGIPPPPPDAGAGAPPAPGGAPAQPPAAPQKFDKPYQDLGELLYKALRINFDDLTASQQDRILNVGPDNIDSDEKGALIFKIVEEILNDRGDPTPSSSSRGPGVKR